MPSSDTCYLHLVRHGATANNLMRPPRLQGRHVDLELSSEGRQQAELTAQYLARRPLAAVYASPLLRAVETAAAIAEPHGLDVQVIEDLTEVDVGRWEGMQWDEIERTEPAAYEQFMKDPAAHGYPDGEDLANVVRRVASAVAALVTNHRGQEIVAVAHNVVNRSYLGHLLGLNSAACRKVPQDNCGVNLLRARSGKLKPLTINTVLHLENL